MNYTAEDIEKARELKAEGYEWIARDKDNSLYAYEVKPIKIKEFWWTESSYYILPIDDDFFQQIKWQDEQPSNLTDITVTEYKQKLGKPCYINGIEFSITVPKKSKEIIKKYETEYADEPKRNANFKISEKPKYERLTDKKDSFCTDCEGIAYCKDDCKKQKILKCLIKLENKIESGELIFKEEI